MTFLALAPAPTPPLAAALDGRRFEGLFIEHGMTSVDAAYLTFLDARLRSTTCDRSGCSEVPYGTSATGDLIILRAETESPRCGKSLSKRVVRDGKLEATPTSIRSGKAPVENRIVTGERI
jgi:hypothetical protein